MVQKRPLNDRKNSLIIILVTKNYTGHKILLPVVPYKAVAEVSRIGIYRRNWLL